MGDEDARRRLRVAGQRGEGGHQLLAAAEIGIGAVLITPLIPNRLAGVPLTAFAGSLVTLYLRTPALHRPGSVWPTPDGVAVSKDVWMLGIGLGLLADRTGRDS